jgi:phosphoglycolate phosphatase/dihydroneopterin aldolase
MQDDITATIDYFQVAGAVQELALASSRQLVETLASDIAALVLNRFAAEAVEVELRKYILPETAFVAVRMRRERASP